MLLGALLAAALLPLRAEPPAQPRGVSPVPARPLDRAPYRRKVALVVGIDRYRGGIRELQYAVRDARAVEDLLRRHLGFDEVVTLEDEGARRADVLRTIVELRSKLEEEDQFFFFFAGHGVTFGTGDQEMGYLVPQDAAGLDEAALAVGGISMADLREQFVRSPAKHVLLAIDACYSGYAAVGARGAPRPASPEYLRAITGSRARQVLTAGRRDQRSFESAEWGHSAFTYKLLQGLRERLADRDRDGLVTAVELHSYLQVAVTELTRGAQTPQFADLTQDEGEFVFVLPPGDAKTTLELSQPASVKVEGDRVEVYDRLGKLLWQHTAGGEIAQGLLADLDGDGANELLVGMGRGGLDSGRVLAFDFRGDLLWSRDLGETSIYEGAWSGRLVVDGLAAGDLLPVPGQEIAVLAVDPEGWPVSRLSVLDRTGRSAGSYWHPGALRHLALVRATDEEPWRILAGGLNNDLGSLGSGEGAAYGLFLLDPADVRGQAPPSGDPAGGGSQLWYGTLWPRESRASELAARDVDGNGRREIVVRTTAGAEVYVGFDGALAGFKAGPGREPVTFLRLQ